MNYLFLLITISDFLNRRFEFFTRSSPPPSSLTATTAVARYAHPLYFTIKRWMRLCRICGTTKTCRFRSFHFRKFTLAILHFGLRIRSRLSSCGTSRYFRATEKNNIYRNIMFVHIKPSTPQSQTHDVFDANNRRRSIAFYIVFVRFFHIVAIDALLLKLLSVNITYHF